MSAKEKLLVLSIRREHATRIFEGSKQFELRKSLPTDDFKRVYLCVSGGGGMVGCFDPVRVIRDSKDALWGQVNHKATTQYRFDRYFENRSIGCAIEIANPVRFEVPISLKEIRAIRSSFSVPMSYVLISLDSPLGSFLEKKRALSRRKLGPRLALTPISERDRATYRKWVFKYIGKHYEGIDGTFAARNLDVHDLGHDPAGFFTENKQVLSVMKGRTRIGFTTITWKAGGCAKTGPTILGPGHRGKGLGRASRRAIEYLARDHGYRKIYCTCADTALEVIAYLLDSGMKVEAHLDRQYSGDHGELVFGKFLVADEYFERPTPARGDARGYLLDIRSMPKVELRDAIVRMFSSDWMKVDPAFADRILKSALAKGRPDAREKAKRLVCVGSDGTISGFVILLPKRGGAVKALLCSSTEDPVTLSSLIDECVRQSCAWGSRKLYFLHPLLDATIGTALRRSQFQLEGFLKAPYRPGEDVGVYSRFC